MKIPSPNHWSTRKFPFLLKKMCINDRQYFIGLAKIFLWFLSKNKRCVFNFYARTLLNNVFIILFHYLLPFFKQFHNSVFPKALLSFCTKNCLLQSSMELNFFSLREFCKDRSKWKSEGAMSAEYGR